jgi:predicted nuclease of predicted toxin-antitoxin system
MNEEEMECAQGKRAEGKLKILVDENILDKNIIKSLEKKFNVKMAVKNRGLEDKNVHTLAITESRVILTKDGHFWDNIKFPMQKTPGIIIIPETDTDETIKILDTFFKKLYNRHGICRYCNGWWIGTKVKVQKTGYTWRCITNDGSISPEERINMN